MKFPCNHVLCRVCLYVITREGSLAYRCSNCQKEFPYIGIAREDQELLDEDSLKQEFPPKYYEISEQIECLKESSTVLNAKLKDLEESKPLMEQQLDTEFEKIKEELTKQYKGFKKEYLERREYERIDMKRASETLQASIGKRERALELIKKSIIKFIPQPKMKKVYDLKFPDPSNFVEYTIDFEYHNIVLWSKVKDLFWQLTQRLYTDLDLEHLNSAPYKKFRPHEYSSILPTVTIKWTGIQLGEGVGYSSKILV